MIPYQPIVYGNDPDQKRRTEDDSIAYTWRQYVDNPTDPEILLQFPSTKAAVKALDAIQEFTKQEYPDTNINKFLVSGGSKVYLIVANMINNFFNSFFNIYFFYKKP